jgi:GTPase
MTQQQLPIVVLCGRPNVGKSSLFNALIKRRVAIVDPTAGVTRDRVAIELERYGSRFQLVDTGGLGLFDEIELKDEVERQIGIALELADLVLFVVDAKDSLMPHDQEIARRLRTLGKPILLVVNKADGTVLEREAAQFLRLGLGDPIAVSALEKHNVEGLCEAVVDELKRLGLHVDASPAVAASPETADDETSDELADLELADAELDALEGADGKVDIDLADEDLAEEQESPTRSAASGPIRLAIVGKVNSGKSTFMNRVVGEERVIVSPIAGTTRDAVDARFEHRGRQYVAIDTAGLRKRRVVEGTPDFYGVSRANDAIRRCDVVLLFVDAAREVSQIDKALAQVVARSAKPVVVCVTKWDLAEQQGRDPDEYLPYLRQQLPLLEFAPIVFLSTHQDFNVDEVLSIAAEVKAQSGYRAPTGLLNRALEQAFATEKPRTGRGKTPHVLYVTQTRVRPPTFVVFVNDTRLFGDEWSRFLANRLRDTFPFGEVPLRIYFRERKRKEQ